jgi:hypothetical protein
MDAQNDISFALNEVNFTRESYTTVIGKPNRIRTQAENLVLAKRYNATLFSTLIHHDVPEFAPAGFAADIGDTQLVRFFFFHFVISNVVLTSSRSLFY